MASQAVQPAAPAVAVEGAAQPAGEQQSTWGILKTVMMRMLVIYCFANFFQSFRQPATQPGSAGTSQTQLPNGNLVPKSAPVDFYAFISENEFLANPRDANLFFKQLGVIYGDWTGGPNGDGTYYHEGNITLTNSVQNNESSLYIHFYFTPAGSPMPDYPTTSRIFPGQSPFPSFGKTARLNKFKRRYFRKTVNLLTGQTDAPSELVRPDAVKAFEVISHWHENLTVNLVDDHTAWLRGHVPPPLDQLIEFETASNRYYPIVFANDYWNLHEEYQPINNTVSEVRLRLTIAPLSLFRLQMYAGQMMRNKWFAILGQEEEEETGDEQDSLKRAMVETNAYLLGTTVVVSILHTIFEFLAFKNDIQFWRSRKTLEGLSVRSVFFNNFQCLIVLLYILDQDTNIMIRISVFVSMLIEMWKITKVVDIGFDRQRKFLGIFPRITFTDKSTYTESQTRQYDHMAFKYLSWLLFPLLIGYAVYSLLYQEHKGWYSWVLSMLYGFLLTFGFISMTPQLFINYKMKSVAHLPWRMLTYKFLNTFIDDLFAFVIRMPNLYRLGCLRDDVIFLIYIYQRYKYPVDKSRVNEFGVTGEELEQVAEPAALTAPPPTNQPQQQPQNSAAAAQQKKRN